MAPAEMKTRLSATQGNREGAADERAAPSQDACPLPSPQADGRPHSSAAVHQLPQRPATAIRPLNTANQLHHERGAAPRRWFCVAHFLAPTHFFLPPPFPLPPSPPPPPFPTIARGLREKAAVVVSLAGMAIERERERLEKAATALDQWRKGGRPNFLFPV